MEIMDTRQQSTFKMDGFKFRQDNYFIERLWENGLHQDRGNDN